MNEMNWRDIDNMFKHYEWMCRKPPTTEELVDGILAMREITKEIFEKYGIED